MLPSLPSSLFGKKKHRCPHDAANRFNEREKKEREIIVPAFVLCLRQNHQEQLMDNISYLKVLI